MELRDRLRSALGSTYTLERDLGHGGMATVYLAATCSTSGMSRLGGRSDLHSLGCVAYEMLAGIPSSRCSTWS